MQTLTLKNKNDFRLRKGHPWIFSNEIVSHLDVNYPNDIVRVVSSAGYDYGFAFYNPNSLVAGRLLRTSERFDENLITKRLSTALEYRKSVLDGENSFRMVFGESDLLPGLIVDKYADYLSVQLLSRSMDARKDLIVECLLKVLPNTKGIIEKDISNHRNNEGLDQKEEVLYGEVPDAVEFEENGIKYAVPLIGGQKTGYFLDQKINRMYLQKISKGKKVLDCFCNQGGFALNAAKADADFALGVDISQSAVDTATNNASINSFTNAEFLKADVFDFLEKAVSRQEKWDIVVLDPPAFTKNRKTLPKAIAGYSKINKLALRLIPKGGYLVSSSCSHHLPEEEFLELISDEAAKQGRHLKLLYRGAQSPDHPILPAMLETNYLKYLIFKVE